MRKKVAIVTFHRAYNYGAVLQTYALNTSLLNLGAECEVLDYYPYYFHNMYHILPKKAFSVSGVKILIRHFQLRHILAQRNTKFENFIKEYLVLGDKTYTDLKNAALSYDGVICGSDQVWSDTIAHFDPVFFLNADAFSGMQKYSYAASFGKKNIPEELHDTYRERLRDFRMISVREESGVPIVEALTGKRPVVCCDPTLLLCSDQWDELCGDKPLIEGEYILLYYVRSPKEIREYAVELAKAKACKVVCVSCSLKYYYLSGKADRKDGFISLNTASPNELLNLIKNARYVLTSSFHGTVFSILFHKQFLSQTCWGDGSENERVINLLEKTALLERSINSEHPAIDQEINWEEVDDRIQAMRDEGMRYLNAILDSINAN